MKLNIKKGKTGILFLLLPSLALMLSGCLDTFIVTIVPSILSAQKCFYVEPILENEFQITDQGNELIFLETSYIISSKILARLPINFLAGYFISKLGSEYVIILGLLIYGASLVMYVFSNSCINFIISRIVEGMSASFTVTASYSFLSTVFVKKSEKSLSMAIANFCYYLGVCFGPIIGGHIYSNYGHDYTFLIIIPFHLIISIISILNLIKWKQCVDNYRITNDISSSSGLLLKEINFFEIFRVFLNPYVIITCIGISICNGTVSAISTVLPQWMRARFHTGRQEQGLVWSMGGLIYGLAELVSIFIQNYRSKYAYTCPIIGLVLISISVFTVSFHVKWMYLSVNIIFMFLGIGFVEYFLFPLIPLICDTVLNRKSDSIAAALITTSNSLGYLFGALIAGLLTHLIGFRTSCIIFSLLIGVYAPVTILLTNHITNDYEWCIEKPDLNDDKSSMKMSTKLLD